MLQRALPVPRADNVLQCSAFQCCEVLCCVVQCCEVRCVFYSGVLCCAVDSCPVPCTGAKLRAVDWVHATSITRVTSFGPFSALFRALLKKAVASAIDTSSLSLHITCRHSAIALENNLRNSIELYEDGGAAATYKQELSH